MGHGEGKGEGNDGGVVAVKRAFLIKTKAPEDSKKLNEDVEAARVATCALSGEPLRDPIVCDDLGVLYNKEAVLSFLLDGRAATSPAFSHLKSLKRVVGVKATPNPSVEKEKVGGLFICPVTGTVATGRQP
jgi:hypothetical protein